MVRRTILTGTIAVVAVGAAVTAASATAGPTLAGPSGLVPFGSVVTLQGSDSGIPAGQTVEVFSTGCGFTSPVPIGTATTDENGTYSFRFQPALNSTIVVQIGTDQSNAVPITVQPQVQLRRLAPNRFAVDVSVGAGQFFTSAATLQRFDTKSRRWRAVASGVLKQSSSIGAVVAVSSATIRAAVKPGTRLRATIGQSAVGSCYAPASSSPLTG